MSLETAILENTKAVNRLADLMESLRGAQAETQQVLVELLRGAVSEMRKPSVCCNAPKEAPEPVSSPVNANAPATAPASSSPEAPKEEPKPLTHEACTEIFQEKMRKFGRKVIPMLPRYVPEGAQPRFRNIPQERLPEFMQALEELQ